MEVLAVDGVEPKRDTDAGLRDGVEISSRKKVADLAGALRILQSMTGALRNRDDVA